MARRAPYIVRTAAAAWSCDTVDEAVQHAAKHPGAVIIHANPDPRSREYQMGVRMVRLALAEHRRNPAQFDHLTPHTTYSMGGHRVRVVDDGYVVVDGVRMGVQAAARKVGT